MSSNYKPELAQCLLMDGIGMASYLIPGLGEGLDFVWAIIAAIVFKKWFGSTAGAVASFAEEAMPFTDIIPAFTIGYFLSDGN